MIGTTVLPFALGALAAVGARAAPQETLLDVAGAHASAQLGFAVASLGDVDGDGTGDFAVAAPGQIVQGQRRGQVRVHSGRAAAEGSDVMLLALDGPAAPGPLVTPSNFASSLDGGRDVDGDGVPDLVVGAPGAGQVFLHSGATGADLMPAGVTLHAGPSSGHGAVVRFLDANGDGLADVLVTRRNHSLTQPGRYEVIDGAWLRSGGAVGSRTLHAGVGLAAASTFGSTAAVIGDLDGDGSEDFALGGPGGDSAHRGGYVEVRSGATGAVLRQLSPLTDVGNGGFGAALTAAGDVDGDGRADLLVGIPTYDEPAGTQDDRGAVEVISGAWLAGVAGAPRTLASYVGPGPGAQLGLSLLGADLQADGVADVVAGFRAGPHFGGLLAISGRTGRDMWVKVAPSAGLGRTPVASIGGGRWLVVGDVHADHYGPASGAVGVLRAHDGRGRRSALGVACPCGVDAPGSGCPHYLGLGASPAYGAILAVERGSLSLGGRGLELALTGGLPASPYQLWAGSPGGATPFQHGLVGIAPGPMAPRRVAAGVLDGRGGARIGPFELEALAPAIAGSTVALQVLYRDVGCGHLGATNASNSYVVELRS